MIVLRVLLVVLVLALAGCGEPPQEPDDRDGDGLTDTEEVNGWTITIYFMDGPTTRQVTSDPDAADTDGDGIPDIVEFGLGSDPRDIDTDDDRLTDCMESFHTVRAQCEDPSWQGEGDGGYRTAANRADSDPGPSRFLNPPGAETRTWGDGIADGDEVLGYDVTLADGRVMRVQTDPMQKDTDGDRLEDGEEVHRFGTHPLDGDSDSDGCRDGFDPLPTFLERMRAEVQELRIAPHIGASAIHLQGLMAGTPFEAGPFAIQGDRVIIAKDSLPWKGVGSCTFSPLRPVIPLTLFVEAETTEGRRLVDVTSTSTPNGTTVLHWDVASGAWGYAVDDVGQDGPVEWVGLDGALRFLPVVKPHNQSP